jgi:hypothetical protein
VIARFVPLVAVGALAAGLLVQARHQGVPAPPDKTASSPGAERPGPAPSPRNANYTITAKLDHSRRSITGEERLTWRNIAAVPASTLQFHLYYNAWRNARSSWMRERALGGDTTLSERPEADWGWIDVTSVRIGAADATAGIRYIAPDDDNADDRTVMEIPLARPVAPGETIDILIAWNARVPRTFSRTGAIGDFYFIAQWFPKIGVLEDTGWNTHQFHASTEFFADFGTYDVSLNVPAGWTVGATGVEKERRDLGDGTVTHRYYQDDVHDFAWTTSPDFIERRARFEHPSLPATEMRLLLQPEHAGQADRHFEATRAALKYYGEWFGAYPYGHITIVDPAWQSGAGGMEYPTLFTAGTRWLAPPRSAQPESVTVHEAGHQFWYGIVASNEFEHAWLDEGLNTFSTARTMDAALSPTYYSKRYFGTFVPWLFEDLPLSRDVDGNRLGAFRPVAEHDAQSTPTWRYWPGSASAITYNKTSLWLHTLERMLGWETLQRAMSTYFSRWAFRHPKPEDFFAVMNEVSGQDLTWFFDQVHRSSNSFDYGVDTFRSDPDGARGFFGEGGQAAFSSASGPAGNYRTTVVVRRYGEGEFPVDIRVTFENGEEARWRWDGRDRWKLFEINKPSRASMVQVDPDRILLLDLNHTNNSATLESRAAPAARKWSLVWLMWLQDHLLTYGFFI